MNSYESYKPSDIDWVGEIPSHWETVQPKYKLNRVTRPIDNEDEVITCFRNGVVTLRKNRREDGFTNSVKEHGYQQIHPGDLVVHEMDGFAGAIGISDSKGKSTPVYTVVEPDDRADLKYIAYLLREMSQTGKIESLARSIRERTTDFRWNMWSVINFPFPPIEEQKLISRYLDKKTSQIDSLVEKIQKKIELLKEQRTSLINNYVTKGLDPNVEMKDSGVEWIGEIPKHWKFTRNKNFLKLSKNIVGENWIKHTLLSLGRSGVTVRDLESGKGKFPESFETYQTVKVGQFVFCLFDIDETPRTVGFSNEDGMITGAYTVFDCSNDVYAEFIYYYYLTIDEFKGLAPHYSGLRKTIRPSKFLSLGMFLPSLQEQMEIVEHINIITKKIDKFIDLETNRKLVLNEYKQSLISSVATGKIRVTEDMI